jgi:branched-chain amino acid transport system substrate-binding protein
LRKKPLLAILPIAVAAVGLSVAGAASGKIGPTAAGKLPSASCSPIFYKGSGSPQYLIASDLPLQGAGRAQPLSMVKAIQYVLEKQFKFRAGTFRVGYQSCDDATAQQGGWATEKCTSNARAYANDRSVLGVLGTFNSGCAKLEIPILNRAPGGAVAMISSANTAVGLTHDAPWNDPGEPNIYYPTKVRNYARVAATDDFQGPFAADLLKAKKKKSVYILHDNQTFGKGVANGFRSRANALDIDVKGFEPWDAKAASYEAIGERIKATGAQSVYFGGIVCNNGVKLLKDIYSVVGKGVLFVGPDGWTPFTATGQAGAAAQGMFVSVAGLPITKLGKTGKAFLAAFAKYQGSKAVDPYAVYAAQTAQIMLRAIGESNGTRLSVVRNVFKTRVVNGIMGTFRFDSKGDICPTKVISFYVVKGTKGVYNFVVANRVTTGC